MCLNSRMPIPTPSAHTSVFIFLLNNAALAMDRSHARGSPRGKEAYYTHRPFPCKRFLEDFSVLFPGLF
jgi:hypothetical protein